MPPESIWPAWEGRARSSGDRQSRKNWTDRQLAGSFRRAPGKPHGLRNSGHNRRYTCLSILSGIGWGLLVAWLASGGFRGAVLGGLIASPVIGWLVGWLTRGWSRLSMSLRIATAVLVLYLAAALFGLAIGIFDLVVSDVPNRIPYAIVLQTVLAFLWGLTFTGYLLFLGPLAYANLLLLGRARGRYGTGV